MFTGVKPHNKMILSVIKDEKEKPIIKLLKKILGNLNEPGTGIIFTIPLDKVEGLKPEI